MLRVDGKMIGAGASLLGAPWFAPIIGAGMDVAQTLFAKHQADTAHQREARDLIAAGINPIMTAGQRGAPVPEQPSLSESFQRGLSTSLAVRMQKAQIGLVEAQAAAARAQAQTTVIQGSRLSSMTPLEMSVLQGRSDLTGLQADQLRAMLPMVAEKLRAEISSQLAGARRTQALAALDELSRPGAEASSALASQLGEAGPLGRLFLEILKALK